MKYQMTTVVNVPRDRMLELFDNPDNMKHWQPDLVSFEHLSGEPGEVGAKSLLKYETKRGKMEMVETITLKNLPEEFSGSYDMKGMHNEIKNFFEVVDENTTKWIFHSEFQFEGFLMKLMSAIMPGMFKKQSKEIMANFKQFAEQHK